MDEPELKYSLLSSTLKETLQGNMITSFKVSLHFIIIGSDSGTVFVLDLLGNLLKRFAHHHGPVNDIAIDSSEEYMSTVGLDGVLVIQSLYTDENTTFQIKSPLSCVQFEPDYSKKTTKAILYGNEQGELTISSKGWFGVTRTVIGSGNGPVLNASWNNDIIIWISRSTTKFYHLKSSTDFGKLDNNTETEYEQFRPVIAWKNENEAYIGFGDSITVIGITDTVSPRIEKKHQIKLESICCGLAPFQEYLLVFGYHISTDVAESINQPQLYILDTNGNIFSNDELEFENPGTVALNARNYQLGFFPSEKYYDNVYYVVSPWNVILAKPRDVKDNVSRILERKEYENAIKIIEDSKDYSKREKWETIASVGLQLVEELIFKAEFTKAAEICPKVFKQNVEKWDLAVKKFAEHQKLRILYPVLPISNPTLSKSSYNLALMEFIHFDLDLLSLAIQSWPSSLYSIDKVINAAEEALQKDKKEESRKLHISLLNL